MRINTINQSSQNQSFGRLKIGGEITRSCRKIVNEKIKPAISKDWVNLWNTNGYDVVLQKMGDDKNPKMFDLRVVHKAFSDAFVSVAWISLESKRALKQSTKNLEKAFRREFVEWAKIVH